MITYNEVKMKPPKDARSCSPNSTSPHDPILNLYNLLLAVFLFVSPWLFVYATKDARMDSWTISILIAIVSVTAMMAFSDWEEWLNLLLGIWLLLAPWVLGFAHTSAMHVSIGVGMVVAYLSALELWLDHYRDSVSQ
jgi:SPW repeat